MCFLPSGKSVTDLLNDDRRQKLRLLVLSKDQLRTIKSLLHQYASNASVVRQFTQDVQRQNPLAALLILEGYERDGFYSRGTSSKLYYHLLGLVNGNVVENDFQVPIWDLTSDRIKQIKAGRRTLVVSKVIKFPAAN